MPSVIFSDYPVHYGPGVSQTMVTLVIIITIPYLSSQDPHSYIRFSLLVTLNNVMSRLPNCCNHCRLTNCCSHCKGCLAGAHFQFRNPLCGAVMASSIAILENSSIKLVHYVWDGDTNPAITFLTSTIIIAWPQEKISSHHPEQRPARWQSGRKSLVTIREGFKNSCSVN